MLIVRKGVPKNKGFPAESNRLGVSRLELFLGPETNQTINISWFFESEVNMMDWIGLFDRDEPNPLNYRDYKSYGVVGTQKGEVLWAIPGVLFAGSTTTHICFRYFDGITGALRAVSPPIFISPIPRLQLRGVSLSGFGKNTVTTRVICGTIRAGTSQSTTGVWENLDLQIACDEAPTIDLCVVDKNRKILAEGSIPVSDLVAGLEQDITFPLRIVSSPRKGKATLTVTFNLLPERREVKLESVQIEEEQERAEQQGVISEVQPSKVVNVAPAMSTEFDGALVGRVSASTSGNSMSSDSGNGSANPSTSSSQSITNPPELPPGWEARVDRYGRVFYMNHVKKKTTWRRPDYVVDHVEKQSIGSVTEFDYGKKYHFVRRTITSPASTGGTPVALRFLQRPDFVPILHTNEEALRLYNSSQVLKHIVHRLRRNMDRLDKYEHNREFVSFINCFADTTQPLPQGWQASGKNPTIFIDHQSRRTSLLDPRLPLVSDSKNRRTRSAPPIRRSQRDLNGNFLDIVGRTDEIAAAVEKRMPELAPKVKRKLKLIDRMGEAALSRLANDVDLIMAISILDSEDNGNTSEFDEKLGHFYTSLQRSGYGKGPQKLKLRFSRANLLHDAFDQILNTDSQLLRKARLSISFDDEDGLDYGGPSRELFFLLSRELFNPYYGLFEYSADDMYTVQINPMSVFVDNHIKWFELAGRVLGLALVHRCLIETFFTRTFYKFLLEQPILLEDLQSFDPEFHQSMLWIRENDITDEMDLTFSTTHEVAGEMVEKELLPNGRDLVVRNSNKEQFIALMVKWRAERGAEVQGRALIRGLHQIIDRDFLRVFSVEQLELVLSGSVEIDLDDWRENTEYRGGYNAFHVVITWFWDTVEAMNNADRLKLLQFVTGTASIPYEGFRALRGSSGPKKFTIEKWGEEQSLPRAHTCFNRLDLPSYPTRHILKSKLYTAITEGINYAIE